VRRTTAKARNATGRIRDAFGDRWDISEFRGTKHGFDIVLGWPSGKRRGMGGCGRPGVVLTKPLVEHLERFRMNPGKADLPLGWSAIRRIREKLDHHIRKDIRRWWESRAKDLAALSGFKFAAKHGKSPQAAHRTVRILLGNRHRQKLWWTAPEVLTVLASKKPDSEVAAVLGISPNSLRRLRSACRKVGLGSVAPRQRPHLWWKAPEVQAVLSSGNRYGDMAATLGIGMGALNSIIRLSRQAGLGPARRYQNWWKTPEAQAVLHSGKKYREMAAELGVGMSVLAWGISESRRAGLGPPRRRKLRRSWV